MVVWLWQEKSVLWPNLKTELRHATNRTGTRILKIMKNTNGFIHLRTNFFTESYISFITTKIFRDTLTRFRVRACGLRSHKLWFQTDISENSSCPMCGHLLEDEVHFLLQCPAYL